MLAWLGIAPSYSRPRVSDDNAFAEALFRTAKYRPEFPSAGFADLDTARDWAVRFVRWYRGCVGVSAAVYVSVDLDDRGCRRRWRPRIVSRKSGWSGDAGRGFWTGFPAQMTGRSDRPGRVGWGTPPSPEWATRVAEGCKPAWSSASAPRRTGPTSLSGQQPSKLSPSANPGRDRRSVHRCRDSPASPACRVFEGTLAGAAQFPYGRLPEFIAGTQREADSPRPTRRALTRCRRGRRARCRTWRRQCSACTEMVSRGGCASCVPSCPRALPGGVARRQRGGRGGLHPLPAQRGGRHRGRGYRKEGDSRNRVRGIASARWWHRVVLTCEGVLP